MAKNFRSALICFVLGTFILGALVYQHQKIESLKREKRAYKRNTEILQGNIDFYVARDSLNVARIGDLQLTIREFEQYRAKDAEIIKSLKNQNRDLHTVITAQSQTISELEVALKDSIIYMPGTPAPVDVKSLVYSDPYLDLNGFIRDGKEFKGTVTTKDYLTITETVEYQRFLGFLWKTSRIKNREFEILSLNPHTTITGFDVITIER
mgnify:CR=1 FL=1